MKKILTLTLLILSISCICFGFNKRVPELTPQEKKVEYFKTFDDAKRYLLDIAFKAVKTKTKEIPITWYSDHTIFKQVKDGYVSDVFIKCENRKLATVNVKITMSDTALKNKKLVAMSDAQINPINAKFIEEVTTYKALPYVSCDIVTIDNNFLER